MKKILFVCLFFVFPFVLNAECDYKTEKNITSLSLYIDYSYEYNEETQLFDITVYNLQDLFAVSYNNNIYSSIDNKALISNISPGTNIELIIFSTGNSQCSGKQYRIINIPIPYINTYYNSKECESYKNLPVCYSKFLNFTISESTFKNAITEKENNNDTIIENNEENLINNILDFIAEHYIKFLLAVFTTLMSYIIYKNKYRRKRHGI